MSATQPASRPGSEPSPTPGGPFDFIVVGAGAAGAVLAHRLTESGGNRVLLLEAQTAVGRWSGGQLYMPGEARDYDDWASLGAAGWDWQSVLPYFQRAESQLKINPPRMRHPLCEAFLAALKAQSAGYCRSLMKRGRCWSPADAYLRPALERRNLLLRENARATRLVFEGWRAVAVEYRQGGRQWIARTEREIIVAAGAVESPRLLQLSGVGDPAQLARLGIRVVHPCPAVGKNFSDRYAVDVTASICGAGSLNERSRGARLALESLKYLLARRGALASPGAHAFGLVNARGGGARPDVALLFTPASRERGDAGRGDLERFPGITCSVVPLRPASRGQVRVVSRDPSAAPEVQPNHFAEADDASLLLAGIGFVRRLLRSAPLASYIGGETAPGPRPQSDGELIDYIRAAGSSMSHPVGGCCIGKGDEAVVDTALHVRGIAGLRVIDASVMPAMPSGDPCAATIMIAEKGADLLLKD